MISKVYAYLGKNQAVIDIPVSAGGAVQVEFKGGDINNKVNYQMATTKVISDPAVQAVIENSPFFGDKIILYAQYDVNDKPEAIVYEDIEDVTDFATAVAFLKTKGAKATQLKSVSGVRDLAKAMHFNFPNWN